MGARWRTDFLNPLSVSPGGSSSKTNNRKIVLYSGGEFKDNKPLNKRLIALSGVSKPTVTYIPSSSDYGRFEFVTFVECFQKLGVSKFQYLPLDLPISEALLRDSLKSDIVFLSGGNTFYFLKSLRSRGLIDRLKAYSNEGGVLAGLSAGAILLTPRIELAGYPSFDRDPNVVGIKNLKSLGILDFEFFPHYSEDSRYRKALEAYSSSLSYPVYAAKDRSGLIIRGKEIQFVGSNTLFFGGKKFDLE